MKYFKEKAVEMVWVFFQLSKFLQKQEQTGIIWVKEMSKGVDSIVELDKSHELWVKKHNIVFSCFCPCMEMAKNKRSNKPSVACPKGVGFIQSLVSLYIGQTVSRYQRGSLFWFWCKVTKYSSSISIECLIRNTGCYYCYYFKYWDKLIPALLLSLPYDKDYYLSHMFCDNSLINHFGLKSDHALLC